MRLLDGNFWMSEGDLKDSLDCCEIAGYSSTSQREEGLSMIVGRKERLGKRGR